MHTLARVDDLTKTHMLVTMTRSPPLTYLFSLAATTDEDIFKSDLLYLCGCIIAMIPPFFFFVEEDLLLIIPAAAGAICTTLVESLSLIPSAGVSTAAAIVYCPTLLLLEFLNR